MSKRYKIVPQMREYDSLGIQWRPYTMFLSRANYKSAIVNTDRYGLRYSNWQGAKYSIDSTLANDSVSVIIGGSTAFGHGSSSDDETIASKLAKNLEKPFLNLGGMAFNSRQELILFIEFAKKIKNLDEVILVTGVNNLYLSSFINQTLPPFFFSEQYYDAMKAFMLSPRRRMLKYFLNLIGRSNIDVTNGRIQELSRAIWDDLKAALEARGKVDEFKFHINIDSACQNIANDLYVWRSMSQTMGFNLIFALQPMPDWSKKILTWEEESIFETIDPKRNQVLKQINKVEIYNIYRRALMNVCLDNDISFVDLNESFKSVTDWLFVDRVHLTDIGNSLVAESLSSSCKGNHTNVKVD
jgi:hypothetical protein